MHGTFPARGSIPVPWLAKFTDNLFGPIAARGQRPDVVRELHRQYGGSASRLRSTCGFELTHAPSSFCRDLPTHRSEPRINHKPKRLQSHSWSWNQRLENRLLRHSSPHSPERLQHPKSGRSYLKNVLGYGPCFPFHAEELLRQLEKLARGVQTTFPGAEGEGYGTDRRVQWCGTLPYESTTPSDDSAEIERSHLFLHLRDTLTSRSILSMTSRSVPPSVRSTLQRMYSP